MNIKRFYLFKDFPTFAKLHIFKFSCFCNDNNEFISLCSKLKQLYIYDLNSHWKENRMNSVYCLKDLETLSMFDIYEGEFTKEFFDYISSNLLKLKFINISNFFMPDSVMAPVSD